MLTDLIVQSMLLKQVIDVLNYLTGNGKLAS